MTGQGMTAVHGGERAAVGGNRVRGGRSGVVEGCRQAGRGGRGGAGGAERAEAPDRPDRGWRHTLYTNSNF